MANITVNAERIARNVIVIGASAGGFEAVRLLLAKLPADLPAFVGIVIHRGAASKVNWGPIFSRPGKLPVMEPQHAEQLKQGVVYIAPSDMHMTFDANNVLLDSSTKQHFTRPAADPLFRSAARAFTTRVIGIVLSGGGRDGVQGLLDITAAGGLSFVQTPDEAEFKAMPYNALTRDHVHAAMNVSDLADIVPRLVSGDEVELHGDVAQVRRHR
ncbi:MAG: chemotaxis protein CheB [Polyangiales bacterium]